MQVEHSPLNRWEVQESNYSKAAYHKNLKEQSWVKIAALTNEKKFTKDMRALPREIQGSTGLNSYKIYKSIQEINLLTCWQLYPSLTATRGSGPQAPLDWCTLRSKLRVVTGDALLYTAGLGGSELWRYRSASAQRGGCFTERKRGSSGGANLTSQLCTWDSLISQLTANRATRTTLIMSTKDI